MLDLFDVLKKKKVHSIRKVDSKQKFILSNGGKNVALSFLVNDGGTEIAVKRIMAPI